MEKDIKSIQLVDLENFTKILNEKFQNLDKLYKIFEESVGKNKWTSIPNKNLYFNKEIMACYPNFLNNFQNKFISINIGYTEALKLIKENLEYNKYGIEWDIQTFRESINSFYGKWHPMESDITHKIKNHYSFIYRIKHEISAYDNDFNCGGKKLGGLLIPIYRLGSDEDYLYFENESEVFPYSVEKIFEIFLKENLIIEDIYQNEKLRKDFEENSKLINKYEKIIKEFKKVNKKIEIIWDSEGIKKEILENPDGEIVRMCYEAGIKTSTSKLYNLLNIDKIRVNLDKYDESILYDVGGGHWDLYNNSEKEELEKEIGKKVYARDPRLDIKKGGIVGIDFGTKSTVVVFQDDKNITLPMRISGTILNKKVENSDYENPTVIEFKDIETFIKDYNENLGRPFTKWTDVTVSHTAFQSLVNCSKENYYSVVSELKQWAGNKKEKLLIKDEKGIEKEINPYLELTEEDIDPIEIYAYYIGSYINNMRNGIYLEYFLSFPVTYEKEIREKILSSFERGIKKSLPKVIIEDENVMKKFKVKHGANEPAAYAVCALQEYGFDPEDDEKVYYGVFDFGGGTLDFDFGIFRESEDIRYDYDLEHFGAGGDRYLGGENILKELAYEVFKDRENMEVLRKENISFARPEWCDRFIGDETFVDSNGNSKLNIKFLMEKLRGIWENTEPNIEEKIKLNLFNKNGEPLTGIEINLDVEKIKNKIYSKIEGGIRNFFIAMEKAFKNDEYDKIYILLAGNSCKHPLVKEIFEKYIQEKEMNIEILPALGTEEAYDKLQEREIEIDSEDMTKPTGKTGVAYGLLESTADSNIKVINRDENHNNEINFKYYVGNEKKKKLKPVLNPSVEYDTFNLFSYIKSDVFNIYYTTLPEASEEKMPIENVKRVRVSLNKEYDSETMIYIKAVGADTIEYVVTEKDINEKEYLESGKIILD